MMHNGVENSNWVYHTVVHILDCVTHSATTTEGKPVLFSNGEIIEQKRQQ